MKFDPTRFMRREIVEMQGYASPSLPLERLVQDLQRPLAEIIKLDTNENPYGPPPKVIEALQTLSRELSIYPDVDMYLLREALAGYIGVPLEHLLVGSGSDDIITLLARLFLTPDDCIVDCPPTFSVYGLNADWIGARTIKVPRGADFAINVTAIEEAVLSHRPKLLFLCSPNNPDGSLIPIEAIERLLSLPVVVVVDEAYLEFTERASLAQRVPSTPNLIVLRTFSKWAGLAGLRVGYGIFPLAIIEHLWKIKQPFNVNAVADVAARAALQDMATLQANTVKIVAERERFIAELAAIPNLHPYPSHANFVLVRVDGVPVPTVVQHMRQHGILIRAYNKPDLAGYIRISVGKPSDTDAVIAALRELMG